MITVVMGLYSHHKSSDNSATVIPCSDMCGIVTEVGEGASWKVGDRVLSIFTQSHQTGQIHEEDMLTGLGLPLPGVLCTHRVFPSNGLIKAPENLSNQEGATLAIAGVTAWMAINSTRPVGQPGGKGETILLQGTGGVSVAGLQIAVASGATSR